MTYSISPIILGKTSNTVHDVVIEDVDLENLKIAKQSKVKINLIKFPRNCLDVLAQQIYGIAIQEIIHINELFKLIKGSYCYNNLTRKDFNEVLKYLAGEYTSLEDRHIYAKIWHDKETGMIGKRGRLARVLYMTNIGTKP